MFWFWGNKGREKRSSRSRKGSASYGGDLSRLILPSPSESSPTMPLLTSDSCWQISQREQIQLGNIHAEMISRSPSPVFSPLSIGEDLTPLPAYKAASTTSIDFSGLLEPPLQLHEDLKSGCGGQLWPAGMVLAHQMLRYHRSSLKNARM